jgi:hypothetical protein
MSSEHGDIYFNVNDICFDNQNHLISADNKGNISISEIRGDKLKVLYTLNGEDGLCGNSVSWILYDGLKYLWAGTNTGLNRIDLEDLLARGVCRINFFDQEEGYTAVSSRNAVLDHQGVLWTGGKEGLVRLNPANLYLARSEKPVIFLADLEINGKQYYHPHYGADSSREHPAGNFTLSNIENRLNFTFNIYNYRNPEKDLFRYKLEGFEQRWSNWTHSRNAFYTNLKPGSYNLCIQSKNVNTGIEAAALEIPFRIIGPWYFRWYSILVFLAVILVPITIISRSRIRQIREVEKEKAAISAKIADLELQALQAQMNPHFIFNAINAIQAYILDNKVDEALLYLSDFAKIVRASLENVNRRTITLEEELDFINSYLNLEKMRFPDKVRWQINLGSQVEPKQLIIPPMVLQPYVENAVRHGIRHKKEGGLLVVKIEILDDNRLHYILEDNGIGRLKSSVLNFRFKLGDTRNEHSTLITEKRIQLLNPKDGQNLYYVKITDLGDETGKATGTRVDIFLPLVRA